jgi:hypothetical protein
LEAAKPEFDLVRAVAGWQSTPMQSHSSAFIYSGGWLCSFPVASWLLFPRGEVARGSPLFLLTRMAECFELTAWPPGAAESIRVPYSQENISIILARSIALTNLQTLYAGWNMLRKSSMSYATDV